MCSNLYPQQRVTLEKRETHTRIPRIYSHRLYRFNISSENDDFGFNSIKKINFSKNYPIKMH